MGNERESILFRGFRLFCVNTIANLYKYTYNRNYEIDSVDFIQFTNYKIYYKYTYIYIYKHIIYTIVACVCVCVRLVRGYVALVTHIYK